MTDRIDTAKERERLALIAIDEFEGDFCSCDGYRAHEDTCDFIMIRNVFRTIKRLLDALDAKDAEIARLREKVKDTESTLDAWFDRRDLAHEAVDQAVLGAVSGYLRTCRVGGLSKEESDSVTAVISDMVRLSVFADLFARAALNHGDSNAE